MEPKCGIIFLIEPSFCPATLLITKFDSKKHGMQKKILHPFKKMF